MSLLSDLPDEILNLISIRLNGFDNCSLWMASDSILRQRLVNNVITDFDIKYTIPGRYLWPGNFLKKLKRLSCLSLVVDKDVSHLPLQNIELFPMPTLKYFKLDCADHDLFVDKSGKSFITDDSAIPKYNLALNFTNLENLHVFGMSSICPQQFFRCLPPKLKSLSISVYIPYFLASSVSANECIKALPKSLTELDLSLIENINWPDFDFSIFPPNLTSLTTNAIVDQDTFNKLPQRFKVLKLNQSKVDIRKISPVLPAGLKTLSVGLESCNDASLSHLQQLETLDMMAVENGMASIKEWPPNLKHFGGVSIDLMETCPFPKHLTKLYLNETLGVNREFFVCLPHTLTDLLIKSSESIEAFKFFEILPKNLESLTTNLPFIETTSTLPKNLKYLSLASYESYELQMSNLDRLPPKLETFILEGFDCRKSPFTIELPETLQEMELECDVIIDDTVIGRLPRGMKSLSLKTKDNVTDAGAGLFPPNLKALYLQRNTEMTDHAIAKLPRNLRYLTLRDNTNLTDKCIKDLPRSLVHLNLDETTSITYRCCKDLPPYLGVLSLANSMDWNQQALKDMPRFLHPFYAAGQLWFTTKNY